MVKRLIIDTRLVPDNLENFFTPDLSWPISQSKYDEPLARFINWLNEIHTEIEDSPRLLNAFALSYITNPLLFITLFLLRGVPGQ